MNKIILLISVIVFFLGVVVVQEIAYPIPELGNCADKPDCKDFCNEKKNINSCLNYAETHEMMSLGDIEEARTMLQYMERHPGNVRKKMNAKSTAMSPRILKNVLILLIARDLLSKK